MGLNDEAARSIYPVLRWHLAQEVGPVFFPVDFLCLWQAIQCSSITCFFFNFPCALNSAMLPALAGNRSWQTLQSPSAFWCRWCGKWISLILPPWISMISAPLFSAITLAPIIAVLIKIPPITDRTYKLLFNEDLRFVQKLVFRYHIENLLANILTKRVKFYPSWPIYDHMLISYKTRMEGAYWKTN